MPRFSKKARRALLDSGCVQKISDTHVTFTADFKVQAVRLNLDGLSHDDVFSSLGVDPNLFIPLFPKKSISRWKKIFNEEGEAALREEKRGKSATGRPKKIFDKNDIKSLQERVALLEAENFLLKKLRALEEEYEKKKRSR